MWSAGVIWLLKVICKMHLELRGVENIPSQPYILASKHQSALETIIFLNFIKKPSFILKKELKFLPVIGLYLYYGGMIFIDRKGKASALKSMIKQSKAALRTGRNIIIFPEGTRGTPGVRLPYHPGVTALYMQMNVPVVPTGLNTGLLWGKKSFLKRPGIYVIEFLPAILPGESKEEFNQKLTQAIEQTSESLI
ncbi:MAG: hypothetical protein RIT35_1724 [Pseudomonadota bacterium]|jgi:1-acyl-sn-glycerol-3-phosphate acyltransferase